MSAPNKPEEALIQQLHAAREALRLERESLVARIATIDEALGNAPAKAPPKPKAKEPKGSIKEDVLLALTGGALPMKEIQAAVHASAASVQSVVYALVSAGTVIKDEASNPKKFALQVQANIANVDAKTKGQLQGHKAVANGA